MEKIGLVITTFNSESYFQDLYNSIPFDRLDEVVVVNGGEPYKEKYNKVHWIQHSEVKFPAVARNDGLKFLLEKDMDHYFVCEDDMIFKSPDIFDRYIKASEITGLQYFIYASISWGSGPKHARTPISRIQYSPSLEISLYPNMCNEFTYNSKKLLEEVGLYCSTMKNLFDADYAYRVSQSRYGIPFWNFPDLPDSDDLIDNNPVAVSRLDSDGQRLSRLEPDYNAFFERHGMTVSGVPQETHDTVVAKLKNLMPAKK